MSIFVSGQIARLELVVTNIGAGQISRHCPRCKSDQSFASSGKFRVNAQKKLIDVWLIWRCVACDQTWNHAIHERQSVRALPPDALEALMRNDADLARHHAGLLAGRLGSHAAEMRVTRHILQPVAAATSRLDIVLSVASGSTQRLDRVLAAGLDLGRGEITALFQDGVLIVPGAGAKALRRPATDGQEVRIDLARCPPGVVARCRAVCGQG